MTEINNKKLCESCFSEISGANEDTCPCCGFNKSEFTPDPMVLPMGTKLNDKIVIGRVMGKGGFGITYLGYDLRMDRTMAVKEYYPNGISYRAPSGTEVSVADTKSAETFEKGAEKFYAEAEMVSQFNGNPNIVSVYDYFRANNTVYLIMEYLSGVTLKNYVKKHGKLTDGQALYVMDKIVAALSITHSAGVLHRDISPDNIMICSDGKIKLIDFGAARQILTESSSNLTVVMKPGYTPIEQYTKKGKQGAWTDIYSLGVSVYYALTTVIIDDPYARMDNDEEFVENKYKINESLWAILKKCTMINATDRYGSAIDLRKALKSVSAPLTAEVIELSAEDLKDDPEKEAEEARTTASPVDGDFPVTVAGDDTSIAEEIEIFETTETAETAPEEDGSSVTETAVTVQPPVEPELPRPSKKKGIIAGICSAAALVVVVVICVIAGINKQKTPSDITESSGSTSVTSGSESAPSKPNSESSSGDNTVYSPFFPEMIDGKVNLELDSEYPGDGGCGKEITRENLLRFDGDIKVTVEFEQLYQLPQFGVVQIEDRNNNVIAVTTFNKGIRVDHDGHWYDVFPPMDKFSFVISRKTVENMSGGLKLRVVDMIAKSAVLEAYDPSEYEPGEDAVIVPINSRYRDILSDFIPKETLQAVGGDARITLDIEYERIGTDASRWDAFIAACDEKWRSIPISVENSAPTPWVLDEQMYMLGGSFVPDKFTFTITQEEIAKLGEKGLCFHSDNLFIKTAAVESANKTETASALKYSGDSIPQSLLEEFDSDVKITLDLENYDMFDEVKIGMVDNNKRSVTVSAYNMTVTDEEMYEFYGGPEKFVFVITKENIASLGGGNLQFKVINTTVKSSTIEKYDPREHEPGSGAEIIKLNDSYPGDWGGSELIPKSTLEAFGGDIRFTLYIEEAAASRPSDGGGDLKLWFVPIAVGEDWSWNNILTIGDNLSRAPDSPAFYLGMCEQSTPVPKVITFVLPQSEISKMGQGMLFQTSCLYVKSAALERA